eukprot:CAMPEP_0168531164 /NCGR_PEP_ID=MMETSP0405-20121227/15226_1 /TAXON_ID=498012 /ORGANISM="Trichosphaerium sp, Strain Am-I-7 wt" /LENGTH=96 /DNA_ID=CAMNT_0008555797 /DNA_START=419 /DNA_END=709 /DNA_ORIENTATION=+
MTLYVAYDSTFWDTVQWQDVTNSDLSVSSSVHELTCVHTLSSENVLGVFSQAIRIAKLNLSNWSTSTGLMDDIFDNTTDEPFALNVIDFSELRPSS